MYLGDIADAIALFASLPERERAALDARCRRLKIPSQSFLYHEGQSGDAVYVLVSGRVGIWSGGERGDPVLLAILGPGEMFGEMAILSNERVRTASTQALSKVEVIQILRTDIETLRQRFPRISDVFIEALLRLVQRLTTQVSELSELDSSTGCIDSCGLSDVYERRVGAEIPISQQQLASMTSVGLRITNRVLNEAPRESRTGRSASSSMTGQWCVGGRAFARPVDVGLSAATQAAGATMTGTLRSNRTTPSPDDARQYLGGCGEQSPGRTPPAGRDVQRRASPNVAPITNSGDHLAADEPLPSDDRERSEAAPAIDVQPGDRLRAMAETTRGSRAEQRSGAIVANLHTASGGRSAARHE